MREDADDTVAIEDLLTIDVDAELRKLARAQLQGSWQLPAELVRRAVATGATTIDLTLPRGSIELHTNAPLATRAQLEAMIELSDPSAEDQQRHAALLHLEGSGGAAFIALVGLGARLVEVYTPVDDDPGRVAQLRIPSGRRGELSIARRGRSSATLHVSGLAIDRARARSWLRDVLRFVRAELRVDGQALPRGFSNAISETSLSREPRSELAIPAQGELARVWLLVDGVVTTHASVSPAPCFEAAIEMAPMVGKNATAADLRAAFDHLVADLVAAVVAHLAQLAAGMERLGPLTRGRVVELVLEAARMQRYPALLELPLVEGRDASGLDRWFSLADLLAHIEARDPGHRNLTALSPGQDPADFVVDDLLLFLGDGERVALARLLDVAFFPPRRRDELRRGGGWRWWKTRRPGLERLFDELAARLSGAKSIPEIEMSPAERHFLNDLQAAVDSAQGPITQFTLVTGAGPVRRKGSSLLVPRRNPEFEAALRHHAGDPTHVYPVALAWLAGRQAPAAATRAAWHAARAPSAPPIAAPGSRTSG